MTPRARSIWNAFWTGGISNPLEVMEQITYLLFIKRLDDEQTRVLNRAKTFGKPGSGNPFPIDGDHEDLRWSVFNHKHPEEVFGQRRGFE